MKKFLVGAAVAGAMLAQAPKAQASGNWGCTVFLCLGSVTNPMNIRECAAALVQIRPWKKPSCPAAKVSGINVGNYRSYCPAGYEYEGNRFDRYLESRFWRRIRPRLHGRTCTSTFDDSTRPSGYYEYYRMSYIDENGRYRLYSVPSEDSVPIITPATYTSR